MFQNDVAHFRNPIKLYFLYDWIIYTDYPHNLLCVYVEGCVMIGHLDLGNYQIWVSVLLFIVKAGQCLFPHRLI